MHRASANPGNRAEYDRAMADLRQQVADHGKVEILTGPCAGMVVTDAASIRSYSLRLWAWFLGD
jgi:hypothetical protein